MNYRKIYFNLIRKRKNEVFIGYTEKHHIIPISLGGKIKDKENIVILSAREHFIAHLLLMKMFSNKIKKAKMTLAVAMMMNSNNQNRTYINSKKYEKIRKLVSLGNSILQKGELNSQYETFWITNGKENKKIKSIFDIPNDWRIGRFVESKKIKEKIKFENKKKRESELIEKEKYYSELYLIYDEKGWEEIKKNYKYSKQNFVGQCKKHVKLFKPQNGKKRGK